VTAESRAFGLGVPNGGRQQLMVTLTVVASVMGLAGLAGWALQRDLAGVIGERAFLWGLLFAFVPVLPLTAVFLSLDRFRPEPTILLAIAILWGALGASYVSLKCNSWLAAQIGDLHGATARSAVFVAPWVEETAKGAVIFAIVFWRQHRFNAVLAGIAYGGLVGVGFAFTENIVYYGQLFQQVYATADKGAALDAVKHLFFWRGLAAPFIHPMFTMLTGAGIGVAVRHRHLGVRILSPVAGFCAAVLLHMGYNTIASFATGEGLTAVYVALLLPTLVTLAAGVFVVRRRERSVLAARLRDYTAYGWLRPAVIPFLVTAPGRRAARRYAKALGRSQVTHVRDFQRHGVELALLRDRIVRGVAGQEEQLAEADLVAALRRSQRQVLLPPAAGHRPQEDSLTLSSSW
jgi:RsiW-degrading membrane proteinase PrsW (M82 family)